MLHEEGNSVCYYKGIPDFALCWEFPREATEQPARNAGFWDLFLVLLCLQSEGSDVLDAPAGWTVQAKEAAAKPGTPKQPPSPNPGQDCLPDWNFKEDTHTDSLYL